MITWKIHEDSFIIIRICNINLIWWFNLEKMAKKTRLCLFGSFKRHFLWLLNDPTQVITWTSHDDYLVPSEYAVSTQSDAPKSRKLPKTSFFAHFCIIYAHYAYLINYAWNITSTCGETFRTTILCNIKSIRATKSEKKANVHTCTIYAHRA